MKILFFSTAIPYPPKGGHPQRTFNLMKAAARRHEIHLIGFVKFQKDIEANLPMWRICKRIYPFFVPDDWSDRHLYANLAANLASPYPYTANKYYLPDVRRVLPTILQNDDFDLVHCDMIDLARYLDDVPGIPSVAVFHNVESKLMYRRGRYAESHAKRWFFKLQSWKMERFEARMSPRFDRCVTVSETDRETLSQIAPAAKIRVIPNGVDTEYFRQRPGRIRRGSILFVGGLRWFPNDDGVLYFLEEIWPLLRRRIPEAHLTLVGHRNCVSERLDRLVKQGSSIGVTATGFVDDVRPYLDRAHVYIVPLRIGGGTRLKILDTMAMSKAIVSTSIGCEGIAVEPGKNILIGDTPQTFADQVVRVMEDDGLREGLEREGRRLVEAVYDWEILGRDMEAVYEEAVGGG